MSVLQDLFETFSRYQYAQFTAHADRALPGSLLAFAEAPDPLRPRLERIRQLLADAGHGANPEIYAPLNRLAAGEAPGPAEADVGLLELHLGLAGIEALERYPDGFYRLVEPTGEIFEIRNGTVRVLESRPFRQLGALRARAFLPYPGLFADVMTEEHYPVCDARSEWDGGLEKLEAAALKVAHYDPDLFGELDAFVSCVGLLPSSSPLVSCSQRLGYFRAVFLNPFGFAMDADMLAEHLIHEYYHQRMRQWWFYEPVEGLPGDEVSMTSPFTHGERSVSVMLQALAIYLEGMRFHLWALSKDAAPRETRSRDRLETMSSGIPVLAAGLAALAPRGSEFADQVAFLSDAFRETGRTPPVTAPSSTSHADAAAGLPAAG